MHRGRALKERKRSKLHYIRGQFWYAFVILTHLMEHIGDAAKIRSVDRQRGSYIELGSCSFPRTVLFYSHPTWKILKY